MPPQKSGSQGIKRRLGHETKTVDLLDSSSFTYSCILPLFFGICTVLLVRSVCMLWKKRDRSCASTSASLAPCELIRIFFCEYGPLNVSLNEKNLNQKSHHEDCNEQFDVQNTMDILVTLPRLNVLTQQR